jgi:hypothetical protein
MKLPTRHPASGWFDTWSVAQYAPVIISPLHMHGGCTGGAQGVYAWHPPVFRLTDPATRGA